MMITRTIYEGLLEECAVIRGQIAETAAKALMLQNQLVTSPHLVAEIEAKIVALEDESDDYFKAIQEIDERF